MKSQYELMDPSWAHYRGCYQLKDSGYHRNFRSFNERKKNILAQHDGYKIRRKRMTIPTVNDDLNHSQMYGRDWKRFTRRKHQYHGAER